MGLRGGGLVLKFALTLYLARYFTLEEIGFYGLVLGAVAVMPAVLGWGLNYFLSRDVVDISALEAGRLMRDRLLVSVLSYVPVLMVIIALVKAGLLTSLASPWVVAGVLLAEALAQDLHLALIGQRRALLANFLFFMRSALWVPLFIILGFFSDIYRSLDSLFLLWLMGAMLHIPIMMAVLHKWPWKKILTSPLNTTWLMQRLRGSGMIYLSDICQSGVSYADRYIILHFLGLEMVGVYTLFWSLGNALYTLVQAALIQTALPQLVSLFRAGDLKAYWNYWVAYLGKVVAAGVILGGGLMLALPLILAWSGKSPFTAYWPLMLLILIGIILRSASDVMRHSFYSRHMDRLLPMLNMFGLAVSLVFNVSFISLMGLWGSGGAIIATGLAMVAVAGWFMARLLKQDNIKLREMKVNCR